MRSRSGLAERGRAVSSPFRAEGAGGVCRVRVACAGEAGPWSVGAWTGAARASSAVARVGRRPTADLELECAHYELECAHYDRKYSKLAHSQLESFDCRLNVDGKSFDVIKRHMIPRLPCRSRIIHTFTTSRPSLA